MNIHLIKTYLRFMLAHLPMSVSFVLLVNVFLMSADADEVDTTLSATDYMTELQNILVTSPHESPVVSQAAVDAAIEIYGIHVPSDTQAPQFDKDLYDRGLTSGNLLGQQKTITIGPAAFTSWGILGSTLGHEAEVHARQSFIKIVATDKIYQFQLAAKQMWNETLFAFAGDNTNDSRSAPQSISEGTLKAEQEAYVFELKHANRFGLTHSETRAIEHVMNTYYK